MNDFPKKFKDVMSCFATGITVVTTLDYEKNLHGITINSFNSVSLSPTLILYSINKLTKNIEIYLKCNIFVVNILSAQQKHLSDFFSKKKCFLDFRDYFLSKNHAPIINNTLGYLECRIFTIYDGGDHHIILGEVLEMKKFENIDGPLIYFDHNYQKLV